MNIQNFMKYKEMKIKYDYMQGFDMKSNHDIAKTIGTLQNVFSAFTEGGTKRKKKTTLIASFEKVWRERDTQLVKGKKTDLLIFPKT